MRLDPTAFSKGALQVVAHLQRSGFEAYVVGGAIRDLLLGKQPKDFDIATNATPEEIKQCFRNARIIGRRFQIVHVRAGGEII
jgi:poly(A) polymerase